jgi:hypothetical protein
MKKPQLAAGSVQAQSIPTPRSRRYRWRAKREPAVNKLAASPASMFSPLSGNVRPAHFDPPSFYDAVLFSGHTNANSIATQIPMLTSMNR